MYDYITPEKILDALRWLKMHHPQYANVVVNENWSHDSKCEDFDLHAGLTNSTEHTESNVASCPVFVKESLVSGSPTSGTDRVNTAFEVQSVSFDREVVNSDHSLSVAMTHLRSSVSKAKLMIHDVPGDGNCLYWSILYQLKARGACTASATQGY